MSEVAFDHAVLRLYDVCGPTSAETSICQSKRWRAIMTAECQS